MQHGIWDSKNGDKVVYIGSSFHLLYGFNQTFNELVGKILNHIVNFTVKGIRPKHESVLFANLLDTFQGQFAVNIICRCYVFGKL